LHQKKAIVEKINNLMALCDNLEQEVKESKTGIKKLMKSFLSEDFSSRSTNFIIIKQIC
jgi:restriction endonuclease S subunit